MPPRRSSERHPAKLAGRMKRRWRVVLLRAKGEILGTVEAPDVASAKAAQRSKLVWTSSSATGSWCRSLAKGGATATWPLTARAQGPDRIRRLGMLNALAEDDLEAQANLRRSGRDSESSVGTMATTSASIIGGAALTPPRIRAQAPRRRAAQADARRTHPKRAVSVASAIGRRCAPRSRVRSASSAIHCAAYRRRCRHANRRSIASSLSPCRAASRRNRCTSTRSSTACVMDALRLVCDAPAEWSRQLKFGRVGRSRQF